VTPSAGAPEDQAVRTRVAYATEEGYVSSLAARPRALIPSTSRPSRLAGLAAMLMWIAGSWLNPADAAAAAKQLPGRQRSAP
jgi:hypothetical protein